jgi:hypothetical protein
MVSVPNYQTNDMQPVLKPKHVLTLSINGATIVPELARPYTQKRGGHHLMLRVTANRKVLCYLGSDVYLLQDEFDSKTKQILNSAYSGTLENLMSRAAKIVTTTLKPDHLKALWEKELTAFEGEQVCSIMDDFAEWDSYTKLTERAKQLEAELAKTYAAIKIMEVENPYLAPVPLASQHEKKQYDTALTAYLKEQELTLNKRDYQMWTTWVKRLNEVAQTFSISLTLFSFDLDFYNKYKNYLMVLRGNSLNTFGAHVKRLKRFLKWAEANGYDVGRGHKSKKFAFVEEAKTIVYMNDIELNRLWDYRLIKPQYMKQIHVCLFQSLTGLRISDVFKSNIKIKKKSNLSHEQRAKLLAAKKHHITALDINGEQVEYLTDKCVKTDGTYKVPLSLDSRIKEILIANNFNMNIISEAHYNRTIKGLVAELYQYHGEKVPEVPVTREDADGVKHTTLTAKNLELGTHSNRRSFVSRHINSSEFNHIDVMEMLGATDIKELQKYMDIDDGALNAKATANAKTRQGKQK